MCDNEEEEDDNVADDCVEDENVEDDEKDHNVAEDEVEDDDDDDVVEDEVGDDDVEDDEKDYNFAEDEVEDDDVEDEDVEGRTDPKTATTVLCEPAQSKCTSQGPFLCKNLQVKPRRPKPRQLFCACLHFMRKLTDMP